MADEYEILPHQLLQDLKFEVEALKKKLLQPDAKSSELILEIESLKDSLHDLQELFRKALEENKGDDLGMVVKVLREKVEAVISQNETIAKALLAISDRLDEVVTKQVLRPVVAPAQHVMGMPEMPGPARMAPRPQFSNSMDIPPPPPSIDKKRGLFK